MVDFCHLSSNFEILMVTWDFSMTPEIDWIHNHLKVWMMMEHIFEYSNVNFNLEYIIIWNVWNCISRSMYYSMLSYYDMSESTFLHTLSLSFILSLSCPVPLSLYLFRFHQFYSPLKIKWHTKQVHRVHNFSNVSGI